MEIRSSGSFDGVESEGGHRKLLCWRLLRGAPSGRIFLAAGLASVTADDPDTRGRDMRSRPLRRRHFLLRLLSVLVFIAGPVFAQPAATQQPAPLQARVDAATAALEKNPRFKSLSQPYRQVI